MSNEIDGADDSNCLACGNSHSDDAQYCGCCGSPKGQNEPAQARPLDEMAVSGSKAPYRRPTVWLFAACLAIAGWTAFANFSESANTASRDPVDEIADAGTTAVNDVPVPEAAPIAPSEPVDPESNAGTPEMAASPTASVQGAYRGVLGKQTVALTFSSDAPDLAMANGTATYRFPDGSGCDSAFRAIEQTASGETKFEQTSAGQGRDWKAQESGGGWRVAVVSWAESPGNLVAGLHGGGGRNLAQE